MIVHAIIKSLLSDLLHYEIMKLYFVRVLVYKFYINNNLFLLREQLKKLDQKMKSKHKYGRNQKHYLAMKAMQKHRRNQILIFRGSLRPLNTEEKETKCPNHYRIPQRGRNRLEILSNHPLDLLKLRQSSKCPRHLV